MGPLVPVLKTALVVGHKYWDLPWLMACPVELMLILLFCSCHMILQKHRLNRRNVSNDYN